MFNLDYYIIFSYFSNLLLEKDYFVQNYLVAPSRKKSAEIKQDAINNPSAGSYPKNIIIPVMDQ